jgi:hypothetical protein
MQDHLRVAIVNSTCPVVQYFKEEGTYRYTLIGLIFVDQYLIDLQSFLAVFRQERLYTFYYIRAVISFSNT